MYVCIDIERFPHLAWRLHHRSVPNIINIYNININNININNINKNNINNQGSGIYLTNLN